MTKVAFIIIVALALIIVAPLAIIWSLNTLFPVLAIPYTIWTWIAAFFLGSMVTKSGVKFKA